MDFCRMIVIDLSKQAAIDADLRVIQQIDFLGNLEHAGGTQMLFIFEKLNFTSEILGF